MIFSVGILFALFSLTCLFTQIEAGNNELNLKIYRFNNYLCLKRAILNSRSLSKVISKTNTSLSIVHPFTQSPEPYSRSIAQNTQRVLIWVQKIKLIQYSASTSRLKNCSKLQRALSLQLIPYKHNYFISFKRAANQTVLPIKKGRKYMPLAITHRSAKGVFELKWKMTDEFSVAQFKTKEVSASLNSHYGVQL